MEVLRRMQEAGILGRVVLVGSWCILFYQDYFKGEALLPPIRTRDMEFLIPLPLSPGQPVNLYELVRDLGFLVDFKGEQGYIVFQHPDLILEFLVPARGRDTGKPHQLRQLGINAQPLRFMDMLGQDPVRVSIEGIEVTVPHPANFALHKLLIAGRRERAEKAEKDRTQAVALLHALVAVGESDAVRALYGTLPKGWRRTIRRELVELGERRLYALLVEDVRGD